MARLFGTDFSLESWRLPVQIQAGNTGHRVNSIEGLLTALEVWFKYGIVRISFVYRSLIVR